MGGAEACWREDMMGEPSSPGDSPRSAQMINPWSTYCGRETCSTKPGSGWQASSAHMGAGRAQQSQLPEEGSEQGTLILPAWVSGKDQMGVEGMRGRVSEAARGLQSKAE